MATPPSSSKKNPVQHEDIMHLLGKALIDPKFRQRLLTDPGERVVNRIRCHWDFAQGEQA